jgi:uncharacterized membrane protein YdbT with pleckstrin-like domain
MSYVEENLLPNEKIFLTAKMSPAVFLSPILFFIISLIVLGLSLNLGSKHDEMASVIAGFLFCFSGIIFLSSISGGIIVLIILLTTEFAVTNKRVIAKTGFIRRNSLDLRLTKIESVEVNQNILGRLLSYGTITLTGTGGTRQSFRGIVDPINTKRKINQIVEHYNSQIHSSAQTQ